MEKTHRPIPQAVGYTDTQPFWEAAARGQFVIQRCDSTGRLQHPPRPTSVQTGLRALGWQEVSGKGSLYSWTLTHSAWPGHEGRVPYLCAYVDLDEGARVLCNLIHCQPDDLRMGMRMRLAWEQLVDNVMYPAFEPDT